MVRRKGYNFSGTQLNRFLHHKIHFITLGQALKQGQTEGRLLGTQHSLQNGANDLRANCFDLHEMDLLRVIHAFNPVTNPQSEHASDMVGIGTA
jgi:hypothetical protein